MTRVRCSEAGCHAATFLNLDEVDGAPYSFMLDEGWSIRKVEDTEASFEIRCPRHGDA